MGQLQHLLPSTVGLDFFEGPKRIPPGDACGQTIKLVLPVTPLYILCLIIFVFGLFVGRPSERGREEEIFSSFTTTRAVDSAVFVSEFVGVFTLFLFSLSFSSFFGPVIFGKEEEFVEWVIWEEEVDEDGCVVDDAESLILKILLPFAKLLGAWAAVLVPKTATSGDDVWLFGSSLLSGVSFDPWASQ